MLQLTDIRKSYLTGGFEQVALDGVSVSFRESEFVAILGPSGSGKTTLLNIIGGLDHADSGDLIIDGISTRAYSDRDWDSYRNHRVGFIFQSYNLIPHQSILANVELALTLSGVGRQERRERARRALEQVGLGEHVNKRPNQLSGGQMQRVAIARALVNDPEIVLADEPTGALDTETGIQVMNLLKEIASDRLVVMVTHNPDLAKRYATRIVNIADGHLVGDNNPPEVAALHKEERPAQASKSGKASMSFLTALSLSFNNLMTKKGRTFLTAFAGSIGIIGIAAILALSNGVNNYIANTEEEALTSYPLTITKSSLDMSSLVTATANYISDSDTDTSVKPPKLTSAIPESTIMGDMVSEVKHNDLKAFKRYLESGESNIDDYVNTIQYDYGITPQIYMSNPAQNGVVQLNPSTLSSLVSNGVNTSSFAIGSSAGGVFQEMLDDDEIISSQMDMVAGRWPQRYDEAVLVLSQSGQISDYTLYSIGYYDPQVMADMLQKTLAGEQAEVPEVSKDFTYEDALNMTFSVLPASSMYSYNAEQGTWTDRSDDSAYMTSQIEDGIQLKIVGVVKPSATTKAPALSEGVAYTSELTDKLREEAGDSEIVKQQLANPDTDVFTGKSFEELQTSQNESFDLSSVFSVDTAALQKAFSFDASSLATSPAALNMDLSGVDTSSLAQSLDVSSLDMSALSTSFNSDMMARIMQGAPEPDFSALQADLANASPAQRQAIQDAQSKLIVGFMSYATSHAATYTDPGTGTLNYSQAYADYLATAEGRAAQVELQAAAGVLYGTTVEQAMRTYMEQQLAPYLSQQMSALMTQAAQTMATQLSAELAQQMVAASGKLQTQLTQSISSQLSAQMATLSSSLASGFHIDASAFTSAIKLNMTQEDLTSLLTNYMNAGELTYDSNLSKLGYADEDDPATINIYPKDFPAKEQVISIIDDYNKQMRDAGNDEATIQYSDLVGTLMSSVTSIVDTISMVLVAFVGISLVVSSIMIAIITYISVLERRKEIGILRAMGASKFNIANIFNAETIIEGLIAGVFAIVVVYVASVPVNAFVLDGWQVPNVMSLPPTSALALIGISVLLTFVAGLIPSSMASRRDPVEALRSE